VQQGLAALRVLDFSFGIAWDRDREDWRTFRVDRISEPMPTRNSFSPRTLPAQDLSRYVSTRIAQLRPQHRVEFDVETSADDARARLGRWATVSALTKTRARVTLTTSDFDGALFAIFAVGVPFRVVTPEFAEHVEQRRRLLASHGAPTNRPGTKRSPTK
jgi:predicted DNA-binding transcriptional regulator YafY